MSRLEELIQELCPNGVEYIEVDSKHRLRKSKSSQMLILKKGNTPLLIKGKRLLEAIQMKRARSQRTSM